jgi:Mn2+/Fe2+ NRAMP family transporter
MHQDLSTGSNPSTLTGTRFRHSLTKVIGPGLVFAGSAVGVSHLVQSTRAGAMYGLGLVIFILLANLAKYPGFLFAPRYAVATGKTVLSSYKEQGKFALIFYGITTLLTMFIGTAATLLVTSALAKTALGLEMSVIPLAMIVSVLGMTLLAVGKYHLLDRIIKILVVVLTITTAAATIRVLPMINWSVSGVLMPAQFDVATILFIAAVVGWMPTPSDVSVWQSIWTIEKIKDTGYMPTLKESKLDFDLGYIVTIVLAICFVILGTALMHGSGETFNSDAAGFIAQVLGLYQQSLGEWSGVVVGVAALAVMFSTFLTILDGWPRGLANLYLCLYGKDETIESTPDEEKVRKNLSMGVMVFMVVIAIAILHLYSGGFKNLVDFAATVSFLTAPTYAYLNHRAIMSTDVKSGVRPGKWMRIWSYTGIVTLNCFAAAYIYFRFGL